MTVCTGKVDVGSVNAEISYAIFAYSPQIKYIVGTKKFKTFFKGLVRGKKFFLI